MGRPSILKRASYFSLMMCIPGAALVLAVWIGRPMIQDRVMPQIADAVARNLSYEERSQVLAEIAQDFGHAWDTDPAPNVGRIGRRGWVGEINQAPVAMNNAGMRASRRYLPKSPDVYRVVCLGDSFVFGAAGPEEDRFGDRLQEFCREHRIEPEGLPVEVLSIGLGSWNLVQSTTYLADRIDDVAPDLIVLLAVENDITEAFGVTGMGLTTTHFSTEAREFGCGVWHNRANADFGETAPGAAQWDLSPISRALWDKAMTSLRRLVVLQEARGGKVLVSILDPDGRRLGKSEGFVELFRMHLARAGIDAPQAVVTYFRRDPTHRHAHDSHPNRRGHLVLRDQYLNVLHRLGWLEVPDAIRPPLPEGVALDMDAEPDPDAVSRFQRWWIGRSVPEEFDFNALEREQSNAFLGGLLPEEKREALRSAPWGTVRTGFLLRRASESRSLSVDVDVPAKSALFPFVLTLSLDGRPVRTLRLDSTAEAGRHRLEADLPRPPLETGVVEVVLRTDSYFTTLADGRMKSYRVLGARVR